MRQWAIVIILLLSLWGSRLTALDAFPLHNDEGLHLTRATQVWKLHPFWQINDGKIINHWLIAAFYPQQAPVFAGRVATVLTAMLGLAAGYALVRQFFGGRAALLAAVLWIGSPYLFFYERLALADAQSGAMVVLTLWASLLLARRNRARDALLTGILLAGAALFKLTAAPFALMAALVVFGLGRFSWRQRFERLALVAITVIALFSVPLGYLFARTSDFFGIALAWVDPQEDSGGLALWDNLTRLWAQLSGFGLPLWTALLLGGLILLALVRRERMTRVLLLASLLPLAAIIILGREVLPRHYVVTLPLMLVLAGAGLGSALDRLANPALRRVLTGAAIALPLIAAAPFMLGAYRQPDGLRLPEAVRGQYVSEHSAGYGLRDAVEAFPQTLTNDDIAIVASMFPDSCRRANFYAGHGRTMICTAAPGLDAINTMLAEHRAVYVLVEESPGIGIDIVRLDAEATQIASYPRPGGTTSVTLWLLNQ